jgi:hypothetical protein
MSRAMAEQGARGRATGVYVGVHEDGEPPRNAAMASAVIFKTCSKIPSKCYGGRGTGDAGIQLGARCSAITVV